MTSRGQPVVELRRISGRELLGWGIVCACFGAWLGFLASGQTWSMAADPHAVVFPAARELLNGKWLDAFAPLHRGQARMPLYPIAVTLVGLWTPTLQVAAQIVNVLAWSGALFLFGIGMLWLRWQRALPVVVIGLVANPTVGKTAGDALPAALFALFVAAVLVAFVRALSTSRPRSFVVVGLLAAAVVQTRFNGIGVVGIPIAVALFWHGPRPKALLWFGVGLVAGLVPLFVLAAFLEHHGIPYPNFYIKPANLAGGEEVGPWTLIGSGIVGCVRLPQRLAWTGIPFWVSLPASAAMLWAVARHEQKRLFRPLLLALALLVGALLPIHHENRFQVPFAAIWWAFAGGLAITGAEHLARRMRITRGAASAAVAIIGTLALVSGIPSVLLDRSARIGHSMELTRLCHALAALGPAPPVRLGVPVNRFHYHWLRGCELGLDLPVVVLPMPEGALGPDLKMLYDTDPGTSIVPIPEVMGRVAIRMHDAPLRGEPASDEILGDHAIRLRLPHAVKKKRCHERLLEHPNGAPVRLVAQTPPTNALELTIRMPGHEELSYVISTAGRVERFTLLDAATGPLQLRYCPANPMRADGEIRFVLESTLSARCPDRDD